MAAMDFSIDALIESQLTCSAASPDSDSTLLPASRLSPSFSPETSEDSCAASQANLAAVKPAPLDLTHLYAETTKQRQPSKMKEYYKFFQIPGIGNLAGGLPNVQFFPYDTLEAKIAKPERWTPSPNKQSTVDRDDEDAVLVTDRVAAVNLTAAPSSSSSSAASAAAASPASTSSAPSDSQAPAHLVIPKSAPPGTNPINKIDLATALQYGNADGYPPLKAWIREFTREHLHPNVPYKDGAEVILTVGSTDGLNKTLELFVNDWSPARNDVSERPGLLCETFVYGNVLSQIAPKGMQVVPVVADADGMVAYGPGSLDDVLSNWDYSKGLLPHIMYTVTMGHNPTGIVLSLERRKQLYDVSSRFDIIIVEDDPYWYLQFPSAAINEAASRSMAKPKSELVPANLSENGLRSSGYEFLDSLVPSFLSIDVDGRVVRLDTFSKTVAPGCRLGWITAQPALIERFTRISETGTQQPSGFVQSLISELVMGPLPSGSGADGDDASADGPKSLSSFFARKAAAKSAGKSEPSFSGWQMGGWVRWLEGLRGEYERRMNRMCTILDEGSFQLKQGTPMRSTDADWGVITKTQLFSYDWPRGGMFVWMRMHFESHPLWLASRSDADIASSSLGEGSAVLDGPIFSMALMILLTSKPYLVLVSPGSMFSATDAIRDEEGWAYFRLCFAAETDENIDACSKRLVAGIQKLWKIKKVQDLEDLLRSAPAAAADATAARDAGELGNLGTWQGC